MQTLDGVVLHEANNRLFIVSHHKKNSFGNNYMAKSRYSCLIILFKIYF